MDPNQPPVVETPVASLPQNSKKKKTGLIIGLVAGSIIVLASVVFLIYFLTSQAAPEDYAKATSSAEAIAKQTDTFNTAGQAYVSAGLSPVNDAKLTELATTMESSLQTLTASHDELSKSPALRNLEVGNAYGAYDKKAAVFKTVATGYQTSIPLYVTMMRTCAAITSKTDIFSQIKEFAAFAVGFTKEQALERFDTKSSGCIDAASKLEKSGDDSFSKIGGVFFATLTDTRKAIVVRYDEIATKGKDQAELNYVRANAASETTAEESLKKASEQQKEEGRNGDYAAELKELTRILKSKS